MALRCQFENSSEVCVHLAANVSFFNLPQHLRIAVFDTNAKRMFARRGSTRKSFISVHASLLLPMAAHPLSWRLFALSCVPWTASAYFSCI